MFGLGMPEILLILAIALIVIGPKKLPDLAKTLGRAMGEFKRSAQDFKKSIDMETTLQDIEQPATDLKKVIKEVNQKDHKTDPSVEPIVDPTVDCSGTDESENQSIDPGTKSDTHPGKQDSLNPKGQENKNK